MNADLPKIADPAMLLVGSALSPLDERTGTVPASGDGPTPEASAH